MSGVLCEECQGFFQSSDHLCGVRTKTMLDLVTMQRDAALKGEDEANRAAARLEGAIRAHRDQRGHDRCRLDDIDLYAILPEGKGDADLTLPPKEEFVAGCAAYWDARNQGTSHEHCSLVNVMAERDRFAHQVKEQEKRITQYKDQIRGEQKRSDELEYKLGVHAPKGAF